MEARSRHALTVSAGQGEDLQHRALIYGAGGAAPPFPPALGTQVVQWCPTAVGLVEMCLCVSLQEKPKSMGQELLFPWGAQ